MSFCDKLPKHTVEMAETYIGYRLDDVRRLATEVIPLDSDSWLAVRVASDPDVVDFAVFTFLISDGDGANAFYECLLDGWGIGGSLRELRGAHWNPDGGESRGTTFHLPLNVAISALTRLKRWFDD